MMNKGISIITNFGCDEDCWYCIWKNHRLKSANETTDWLKLSHFIKGHKKVSVSGGGDPLFKYQENGIWWDTLFEICDSHKTVVDVHTRVKLYDFSFWKRINKVSFSCDNPKKDFAFLSYLSELVNLRIVHCVTAKTTDSFVFELLKIQNQLKCQLTLKQLVGYNDHQQYLRLKLKFPDVMFLDKGDYNEYFMPDNTIQTNYLY